MSKGHFIKFIYGSVIPPDSAWVTTGILDERLSKLVNLVDDDTRIGWHSTYGRGLSDWTLWFGVQYSGGWGFVLSNPAPCLPDLCQQVKEQFSRLPLEHRELMAPPQELVLADDE